MASLLTCQQALALVAAQIATVAPPQQTETVPLANALNRILAQTVVADRDQPPFPRSTRDGYAVIAASIHLAPAKLIGSIRAGEAWHGAPLRPDEALEIMTGAPIPAGADAVVMLEHITLDGGHVSLRSTRSIAPGENIIPRGDEASAGDHLLHAGTRITPSTIALAASVGVASVLVYRQPSVAILSTGDELVNITETPGPTQIRNSNAHALAALVTANGGVPHILPIAADTQHALHASITSADHADMLLLSGGVSAGKYDFVEDVLLALGAHFHFTGVAIQPGKPLVFGSRPSAGRTQWLFGLPGNPISTFVTATLFAMPMLRALAGDSSPMPHFALATLTRSVVARPSLTRFVPALLTSSLTATTVTPTGSTNSGDVNANARANCYLVVPPGDAALEANATVSVLLR